MKKLLLVTLLAIGLHAFESNPLSNIIDDRQLLDISIATIECYDRHPVLIPQAGKVVAYATTIHNLVNSKLEVSVDQFECAIHEVKSFRKNLAKLCGGYNNSALNKAFVLTGWSVDSNYTLLGYIAAISVIRK